MEQEQRRGVPRSGFAIEDIQPVDIDSAEMGVVHR